MYWISIGWLAWSENYASLCCHCHRNNLMLLLAMQQQQWPHIEQYTTRHATGTLISLWIAMYVEGCTILNAVYMIPWKALQLRVISNNHVWTGVSSQIQRAVIMQPSVLLTKHTYLKCTILTWLTTSLLKASGPYRYTSISRKQPDITWPHVHTASWGNMRHMKQHATCPYRIPPGYPHKHVHRTTISALHLESYSKVNPPTSRAVDPLSPRGAISTSNAEDTPHTLTWQSTKPIAGPLTRHGLWVHYST